MTQDALEPGPNNDYPAFPRKADGSPYWSDSALTDGLGIVVNGVTVAPMPRGIRIVLRKGERIVTDITPRGPGGVPIDPPVIP